MNGLPLLSIAIWLPVVGAAVLMLISNRDGQRDGLPGQRIAALATVPSLSAVTRGSGESARTWSKVRARHPFAWRRR